MAKTTIEDIPTDVLYLIFPYLSAAEFLHFTCSNKHFYTYSQDPTYWRTLTQETFRFQASPLLQADGTQWQRLFKRLLTQTQLFTWGNNDGGNLGYYAGDPANLQPQCRLPGRRAERSRLQARRCSGYPMRPDLSAEPLGILTDVQCGGWSTTILNSFGALYLLGILNPHAVAENSHVQFKRLEFPPGYPPTTGSRYEPSTAIEQFSTGRDHVLGLSDDGKIWSWTRKSAVQINFVLGPMAGRRVLRVVAGWDRSSAYIKGIGIVFWKPETNAPTEADILLTPSAIIRNTGHTTMTRRQTSDATRDFQVGEVTNYIVLEGYIVFITNINKLFAYPTALWTEDDTQPSPVELTTFYPSQGLVDFQFRDLQGSFRSFAVFTASGEVLIGSRSLIDAFFQASTAQNESVALPEPTRIPSLQNQSVISLAFGDYHIHALHSNGTISSFGTDPSAVGAFGLGNPPINYLRGAQTIRNSRDTRLSGDKRRTVWFEPLMEKWLQDSLQRIRDKPVPAGQHLDRSIIMEAHAQDAYGDYFEGQGSRWEEGASEEEGELPAYFALKVSAAGWHSAARARRRHIVQRKEKLTLRQLLSAGMSTERENHTGDKGWESISTSVAWVGSFFYCLLRWFLGLTARDAATEERRAREAQGRARPEGMEDRFGYVWDGQALPEVPLHAVEE